MAKVSEAAAKYIAIKIKYLMTKEGLSQSQAAGKAYGMAREKFGAAAVPKK